MKEPVLVILAAGMGSRFGGLKQITPVDDSGHSIIDFSLFDAYRAGFRKVAFIIKHAIDSDFRARVGTRAEKYFDVSYRTQRSMEDYCYVAQKYMTNDQYDRDSTVVAMDYAVAQKLLPKIKGSGHEFKKWLQDVAELCKTYSLIISADLINAIIQKGDKRMSYYSFF